MNPDRLIDIESKLAFHEDAIQALNDGVCRQQEQIEQLEATLLLLIDRYRQLSETQPSSNKPVDERPPHY
jgi:SlyX protein